MKKRYIERGNRGWEDNINQPPKKYKKIATMSDFTELAKALADKFDSDLPKNRDDESK